MNNDTIALIGGLGFALLMGAFGFLATYGQYKGW